MAMEENPISADIAGVDAATENTGDRATFGMNVSVPERWISAVIGGALIAYGIRRRSWAGGLLALAGGTLLLRGTLGRSFIYRTLGIDTSKAFAKLAEKAGKGERFTVEKSIRLSASAAEAFRFWRNFENLPRVMRHLKSVRTIDERRSHWVATAPAGLDIEWDAEITDERQDRKIAWRSLGNAELESKGVVLFEPVQDGNATELRVYLEYAPPGGKAGKAFAKLFGKDPAKMVEEDLRRFKSLIESGEPVLDRKARG
jgi:uncharacterized membrane protein